MNKQNKSFLNYLSKYLLISGIICLLLLPVYIVAFKSIKENELQAVYSGLDKGMTEINNTLTKLLDLSNLMIKEPTISKLTNKQSELENQDYPLFLQARAFIESSIVSEDLVTNAYILSRKNDIFLSNKLVSEDRNKIYDSFYQINGFDTEQWLNTIFTDQLRFHFIPETKAYQGFVPQELQTVQNTLHLVVPSPTTANYTQPASIVFMLSTDKLLSRLCSTEIIENGFAYLTDSSGKMITSINYDDKTISMDKNIANKTVHSQNYTVMKIHEAQAGISAVVGIRDEYFSRRVKNIQITMLIYTVIMLVSAVVLAVLFAYKQYLPFKKLVSTVQDIHPEIPQSSPDYEYISNTIQSLNSERKQFQEELHSMDITIRSSLLGQLLQGHIQTKEDEDRCHRLFSLSSHYFCVCSMRIDKHPEESSAVGITTQTNAALQELLIQDLGCQIHLYNEETLKTIILISCEQIEKTVLKEIEQTIVKIVRVLAEQYHVQTAFGIGPIVRGLRRIYISTDRSRCALRMADESNAVQIFSGKEKPILIFDSSASRRLYDLLILGEMQSVNEFFQSLSQQLEQHNALTTPEACQLFYGIRSTIESVSRNTLNNENTLNLPIFSDSKNIRQQLLSFLIPCQHLCNYYKQQDKERSIKKQHEIIDYILKNYNDSDLCAWSIAEHFSVTEKYVYNVVKSHTQKSLGTFLEETRFTKVEELLSTTVDINTIPQMVGFNSVNTFYKAFKRVYGVSPGKWRSKTIK